MEQKIYARPHTDKADNQGRHSFNPCSSAASASSAGNSDLSQRNLFRDSSIIIDPREPYGHEHPEILIANFGSVNIP